MKLFKNTFVTGLIIALSVVTTDYLTSVINHTTMSTNALIVAGAIAVVGYVGKFLTGVSNTNVAMLGSALLAILPLITEGKVDWKIIIATFVVKLLGLLSEGQAGQKEAPPAKTPYSARI